MKKKFIFLGLFMTCFELLAQKVDLDRFYFDVTYQILPREFVPFESRTFGSNVKVGGAILNYTNETAIYDKINVAGWKKVEANPTVGIDFNLEDFVDRGANVQSRTDETKDKDGKVISRTSYYFVVAKYAARGYAKVKGPITPIALTEKQLEEKKAKEASVATNRFLKNVAIKKDTTVATDGFTINYSRESEYKSKDYSTNALALLDFNNNKSSIYETNLRSFVDNSIYDIVNRLNNLYGFKAKKDQEILWILDAKSDEGKTQIEAVQAVKALFATMKADEPIDDLKSNIQPLIEYFDSIKTKYNENSKPHRKMRYSAYFNLAEIYLMIDQPEKAIIEAEKLIENDYDSRDGVGLKEQAKTLIETFKISKLNSRHNPSHK
jgi:hypothetical protein